MNIQGLFLLFSAVVMSMICKAMSSHFKCRGGIYPRSNISRFPVPDDKVSWDVNYSEYQPPEFTSPGLVGQPWADPSIDAPDFDPKWNRLDRNVNRESYTGDYIVLDGYPVNPVGRTGIVGRGVLGRWGPNHAADPVVTRWKKLNSGDIAKDFENRPILQFIAIKRGDTGEWALPGGMVDPGERVGAAAIREFQEEALNSLQLSPDVRQTWLLEFERFFSGGDVVYKGYVDDRRNTDNAWMETVAFNFHDETGDIVGKWKLQAGDDAVGVRWVDITPNLNLYASHKDIVEKVIQKFSSPQID